MNPCPPSGMTKSPHFIARLFAFVGAEQRRRAPDIAAGRKIRISGPRRMAGSMPLGGGSETDEWESGGGAAINQSARLVAAAPIDSDKLPAIEAQFGALSARLMLQSVFDEAESQARRIEASLAAGDVESARSCARQLQRLAAMWAAGRLAEAARMLERDAATQDEAAAAINEIVSAIAAARLALRRRVARPDGAHAGC